MRLPFVGEQDLFTRALQNSDAQAADTAHRTDAAAHEVFVNSRSPDGRGLAIVGQRPTGLTPLDTCRAVPPGEKGESLGVTRGHS